MSNIIHPFKQEFLSHFSLSPELFPFKEEVLFNLDQALADYEKSEIDWHLEKALRQKNNFLASFAVSKAEDSSLTLLEAKVVYDSVEEEVVQSGPHFITAKIKAKEKLNKKDHDHLEYYNIVRTFKSLGNTGIKIKDLKAELIINLHRELSANLDIFAGVLPGFEIYNSGKLRNSDKIKVGEYQPAPYCEIEASIDELIKCLKKNPSATNIFVFHAALYALHPFRNGNKRVCRVLEHFLLQDIGYNQKNFYSTSYYYHKNQPRYYKNLIEALYKKNLNFFVSFSSEALFFSIVGVMMTVLQGKKKEFLDNSGLNKEVIKCLKPLLKKKGAPV